MKKVCGFIIFGVGLLIAMTLLFNGLSPRMGNPVFVLALMVGCFYVGNKWMSAKPAR